ncbi:MAG TPA: glycosyltransferase [Burkholderiaceae bacterium]|nr:glycosyltransferase [Burkholderiaceae bacterium]
MTAILLVNNYHYRRGGAEVVYLQQSEMLAARGWSVANFAMEHPKNDPSPWSDYFAREIELGGNYGPVRNAINATKIIYSREAYRKIGGVIAASGAQLVHAHNIYHHLSPSVLKAAHDRGIPAVLTLHDLKLLCPSYQMLSDGKVCEACKPNKIHQVVVRRCLKGSFALSALVAVESGVHRAFGLYRDNVARFVSPSRFLIDKFVEWGWERERFAYVPNCVDPAQFVPSSTVGQRFLYVGRLSAEKGIHTLIRAAGLAGVGVDIVGTGPAEAELKALAASSGADARFLGFQKGDPLWNLFDGCRAVVLPSEWYENAPISLLEAFAKAKPVIAAEIGGIPEMIEPGGNGELFASGDCEQLAQRLAAMAARSDAEVAQMGRRAREIVEAGFSPEAHYRLLSALYRELGVSLE